MSDLIRPSQENIFSDGLTDSATVLTRKLQEKLIRTKISDLKVNISIAIFYYFPAYVKGYGTPFSPPSLEKYISSPSASSPSSITSWIFLYENRTSPFDLS